MTHSARILISAVMLGLGATAALAHGEPAPEVTLQPVLTSVIRTDATEPSEAFAGDVACNRTLALALAAPLKSAPGQPLHADACIRDLTSN